MSDKSRVRCHDKLPPDTPRICLSATSIDKFDIDPDHVVTIIRSMGLMIPLSIIDQGAWHNYIGV
jgi:hypothetical protein